MVGESKILTVSYGTFSCTLEGFDDPFSTMKAIAEYFRDLAAGDRFFGAEPPQPDADMLHQIAEQTVQARVNAEVTDNSLILRQDHSAQAETAEAPAAPVDAPAEPVAAPVQQEIMEPTHYTDPESIAAKLQRIRAVVSREAAEPAEEAAFYSEDEHADQLASSPAADAEEYEEEEVIAEAPVSDMADEGAEDAAPTAGPFTDTDAPEMEGAADTADTEADAPEMEAASEVADTDAEEELQEDAAEFEPQDDAVSDGPFNGTESAFADTPVETEMSDDTTDEADADAEMLDAAEAVETNDTPEADDLSDLEDTSDAETAPAHTELVAEDASDEDAPSTEEAAEAEDAPGKQRRRIIVQKVSRAEVEAVHASDEPLTLDEPSDALDPEAEAALMRELAEVEADMEAETADMAEPAEADVEAEPVEASEEADSAASDEAETDAEVETSEAVETAESVAEDATAEAEAEADALAKLVAETTAEAEEEENRASRIARRSVLVEDEDAALNRLMDATSTRLSDDDEGAVRRASIAHLKAAVAATKADDSIAQAAADEEERELDQYRSDLARVVRPGRAKPNPEGTATSRPSPLVLISEQRIDEAEVDDSAAAALDVRPRRITSGNLALQEELDEQQDAPLYDKEDVESFSDYAARFAALELPDLLEAAAAHYTYVEGTPGFTRPMLMRKISAVASAEAPSREAGLRSFGSLLREGKIVKAEDGKFVISEKSRFTPEAQKAGE